MKPIKLNQKQLRGLISEAITSIPFGEAAKYFEEMMTPEVNEAETPYKHIADTDGLASLDEFVTEVEQNWLSLYDEGDPSMASLGRPAWEQQVSSACDKLVDAINNALGKIELELIDGQYYNGPANLGGPGPRNH